MEPKCYNCNVQNVPLLACTACMTVCYCSRNCQRNHWIIYHKHVCNHLKINKNKLPVSEELYRSALLLKPISDEELININIDLPASKELPENISSDKPKIIGRTLLSLACREGNFELVKQLLKHGSDPKQEKPNHEQPIITATRAGHFNIVEILINNGADINCKMIEGWTPLLIACARGHDFIDKLIKQFGADPNIAMEGGATPILIAAAKGFDKLVKILFKNGANINAPMDGNTTPLIVAAQSNRIETCRVLLLSGADIEKTMDNGGRPLYIAAQNNHLNIIKLLVEFGANIDARTSGFLSIEIARLRGNIEVVQYLESITIIKQNVNLDYIIRSILVGELPLNIIPLLYCLSKNNIIELYQYVSRCYQDILGCYTTCCHGVYVNDDILSTIGQDYDGPVRQTIIEFLVPSVNSRNIIKQIKFILDKTFEDTFDISLEEIKIRIKIIYSSVLLNLEL
jgi:ankyrin repeat protein